jgi:hypothetical protein
VRLNPLSLEATPGAQGYKCADAEARVPRAASGRRRPAAALTRDARRGPRLAAVLAPLALAAYAVFALARVEPDWRPEWDSALYVLTGRSLAEGGGYRYQDEPFTLRPPGLPWLISLVSGGPFDPAPLNRLVMGCAAASVAAAYFAFARSHGRAIALGAAWLAGTTPLVVERFNWVLSEFPFVALLYLGFGLVGLAATGPRPRLAALLAALALAGAFWMRTVAVLALPALGVLALVQPSSERRTRLLGVLGATLLLCAPWWLWARAAGAGASDQLYLADYATALLRVDPGDPGSAWLSPGAWLARLAENGVWLLRTLGETTLGTYRTGSGAIVAALAGVGVVRAWRRAPSLGDVFGVGYAALLLAYFVHEPRLVVPVVPLVYLHLLGGVAALGDLVGRAAPRLPARGLAVGLACAALLWANAARLPVALDQRGAPMINDLGEEMTLGARWNDVRRVADWIRANTPADAVILSHDAPIHALLTGRRTYTHRFAPGPRLLRRYAPDFVVFDRRTREGQRFAAFVAARAPRRWIVPSDQFEGGIPVFALHPPRAGGAAAGGGGSYDPR